MLERSTARPRKALRASLVGAALAAVAWVGLARADLAAADEAWARRGSLLAGEKADPAAILEAIGLYEEEVTEHPDDLAAQWKLLRALHYRGEHTPISPPQRKDVYQMSREVAERALELLHGHPVTGGMDPEEVAAEVRERPEAAPVHFWAAMAWGLWGDTQGAMAAVRRGVAKRVRLHAEVTILLDETFDDAGGDRFLGRLHTEAPKVPLFTGWIDRDEAVRLLERAVDLAPADPFNRVYLADALLRFRKARRDEALRLLEDVLAEEPEGEARVELLAAQGEARELLERHGD